MEGEVATMQDLFLMDETNPDSVAQPTGFIPKLLPRLQDRGINIEADYFG